MSRYRQPDLGACPADLLFPPAPSGNAHDDAALLDSWGEARWRWHQDHAVAGVSELGSFVDHLRAKTAARMFYLAARGRLDPRKHIPFPECWQRRWDERPRWFGELPDNTTMGPVHEGRVVQLFDSGE